MIALKEIMILVGLVAAVSGGCLSESECPSDLCCLLKSGNHPRCSRRGFVGDKCRPGLPIKVYETIMAGMTVKLEGVYYGFCPCGQGLDCRQGIEKCTPLYQG